MNVDSIRLAFKRFLIIFRPKKKKKAGGENGEGSSNLQPNEIEIIFRNHPTLPQETGIW